MFKHFIRGLFLLCLPLQALAAEKISCEEKSFSKQGLFGTETSARISQKGTPDLMPEGSFLLASNGFASTKGGQCTYQNMTPSRDPDDWRSERYLSASDNEGLGFECAVKPSSVVFYTVTVKAWVCKFQGGGHAGGDNRTVAAFSNEGLGGGTVAIARTTKGPVPYGIRVCNHRGGADIDVDVGDPKPVRVKMNACMEVDRPAHIFFRTPETVSIDEFGAYTLFAPGTFKKPARVGGTTPNIKDKRITVGEFKAGGAACVQPNPGEPFDRKSYWGWCKLTELKEGKNYRVCLDDGYSAQDDKLEYPGSLLRMIVVPKRAEEAAGDNPDSYQYMSVAPRTCRDLFGVEFAAVLVFGNNDWNDQSVSNFRFRYAEIPAPAP